MLKTNGSVNRGGTLQAEFRRFLHRPEVPWSAIAVVTLALVLLQGFYGAGQGPVSLSTAIDTYQDAPDTDVTAESSTDSDPFLPIFVERPSALKDSALPALPVSFHIGLDHYSFQPRAPPVV